MPKPNVKALLPLVTANLQALAGTPMQPKLKPADIPALAKHQAQVLAFLKAKPKDIERDPLLYVAQIDFYTAHLQRLSDGEILNFLKFVGRPLSKQEFAAWFLGPNTQRAAPDQGSGPKPTIPASAKKKARAR